MPNTLTPGQVRVGQLFMSSADGGRPMLSAALTFDDRRGARLLVPYVAGNQQFDEARRWFRTMEPPPSMLFVDNEGVVTLLGVRWQGHSGANFVTGRLTADNAIFGQPRTLKAEYRVRSLQSTIDGLDGFTHFNPVKYEFPRRGEPAVISLDEGESVSWRSAGFTYTLRASVVWSGTEGRQFEAQSLPAISTSRSRRATLQEHLHAQRAVRDLLLLAHGQKLSWRSHRVVDEQFPLFTLDGVAHEPEPAETLFAGTVGEHALPVPPSINLAFPALNLRSVGRRGLKRWTDAYSLELFRRAVQPVAEVLNGAASFLEPQLMMLASALDYFGYYRFGDGRRRPMYESIQKCLDDPVLDWPRIGSPEGIARAIASINNDLKHPDRERKPESDELACVVTLAKVIARAQPFDLIGVGPHARRQFLESRDVRWAAEMFERCGISICDDGSLKRMP